MTARRLIYFADPMCSWCYGFSPVIRAIRAEFGPRLPIQLVMGGLRPGNTDVMTDKARANLLGHWAEIGEVSGQPFDGAVLDREGFLYDTDPAARAVVIVRRVSGELALDYLARAHRAFYAEGLDVTSGEVLADLAAELGLSREGFLEQFGAESARHETWADYGVSQRAGITGYPTLVGGPNDDGAFGVVTRGYAAGDQVLEVLRDWMGQAAPAND